MARTTGASAKNLPTIPPVLTGESRSDRALWQLSSILAEIAGQAVQSKNDGGASAEKHVHHKMNNGEVSCPTEGVSDV